ncbi:MAG: hypothetical protein ACIAQZ_13705 [Sedimentisphaeraceae bacterium JB056]
MKIVIDYLAMEAAQRQIVLLAKLLKAEGYNFSMLYQHIENPFYKLKIGDCLS